MTTSLITDDTRTDQDGQTIFIVGCGRSGTTVVYETLAAHPETAWCSTWTELARHSLLAIGNPLFDWSRGRGGSRVLGRYMPRPAEAYRQWDAVLNLPSTQMIPPAGAELATTKRAQSVNEMVSQYRHFGRGRVFINKNTRNSRRIQLLSLLVPECVVVHVVRHPLDTVSSLLSVAWWRSLELWTRQGRSPGSFSADGVEQAMLAAELWVAEVSRARLDGIALGSNRYIEMRYEGFVRAPMRELAPVLNRVGMREDDPHLAAAANRVRPSSVGAWRSRLTIHQQQAVISMVELQARQLGYDI